MFLCLCGMYCEKCKVIGEDIAMRIQKGNCAHFGNKILLASSFKPSEQKRKPKLYIKTIQAGEERLHFEEDLRSV